MVLKDSLANLHTISTRKCTCYGIKCIISLNISPSLILRLDNPGPVIEPRVHYKVPDFSHLDYLTKALGFQNQRGVRVPGWSQLRNPRWRPAAILKMKFVISSHPIVIQSHVIYQNILFQTRRIHFCHHNWFSWSLN